MQGRATAGPVVKSWARIGTNNNQLEFSNTGNRDLMLGYIRLRVVGFDFIKCPRQGMTILKRDKADGKSHSKQECQWH